MQSLWDIQYAVLSIYIFNFVITSQNVQNIGQRWLKYIFIEYLFEKMLICMENQKCSHLNLFHLLSSLTFKDQLLLFFLTSQILF